LRGLTIDISQIASDEERILRRVNWLLDVWKQPPLSRLSELYADVDETFLTNLKELDHCPSRPPEALFWGPTNENSGGKPPQWPDHGDCSRIFAYLKHSPRLSNLLQSLKDRNLQTLIYPDAIPVKIRKQFESDTLRFAPERPDPAAAARQCDFAILNATPGTTCDLLLAGKPILQFPIYGEQQLMAEACERLDVSQTICLKIDARDQIDPTLDRFLANLHQHTKAAQAFAAKYADFNPQAQREKMLARTLELLESPAAPRASHPDFALHYP
jgi:UDP:flavonoid glycosyltransferase YjiC (YdhE family)